MPTPTFDREMAPNAFDKNARGSIDDKPPPFEVENDEAKFERLAREEEDKRLGQDGWGELDVKDAMLMGDVDAAVLHWCQNACKSSWLEVLILLCILLNTVLLAVQNPATTLSNDTLYVFMIIDLVLTGIFTVEMCIRIIAMGLYNGLWPDEGNYAYLCDAWNKLDFVVVISSWVNVLVELTGMDIGIEVSTLRALRIMRVLRSLRFFAGIKTILSTIGEAIPYSVSGNDIVQYKVYILS